ncbi:endonuclease/exonuclease/phosphatase family protein [Fodinibius halophilus]|uniref:Endonuclease n=1 Tax=Fodinibius halophilus TaxID=1736908 RepID=A0A6M1T553_9BACT|nr:endonuclease/exonuclease/phosphatase family protein [Fodinibius halophilus]NGP89177.1 endonuclease [Fodinibius halophilus]
MAKYLFILFWFIFSVNVLPATAQDTLTVMSYNIYHGEHYYETGESNLQGIADVINSVKPDLVALQEVDSLTGRSASFNGGRPVNQVEKLAELTGMHGYFGKAMNYDGGGYGEGILAAKSIGTKRVDLPIPKGGEPRTLLLARYPVNKQQFITFGGTHLCHQHHENRIAQMKRINSFFSGSETPAIIAGDFNFTPQQEPYQLALKEWFDAAKLADKIVPTIPYDNPTSRIDYIFLSGKSWEVIDMKVLRENNSDHMPIVLTLVI